MSDHDAAPTSHDEHGDTHADAADAGGHGHGHDGPALGPVDWKMWGIGVLGVVVAFVIVAGFAVATSFVFTA